MATGCEGKRIVGIPDFTTVVGVDAKHLDQLRITFPTWKRHKPGLLERPMLVFFDYMQVADWQVRSVVDHPDLRIHPWPGEGIKYEGIPGDKWNDPQRYKMLAGFVYVPGYLVDTPYWLKLDVDTVATGRDDWIDSEWFADEPAFISHPWGFTKPADQMVKLDEWVDRNREELPELAGESPLDIVPKPGWSRVRHKRIISWCAFFNTEFTRRCAASAAVCGPFQLPVPSQDGFMFYVAKRLNKGIVRANMKRCGWGHWTTMKNIEKHAREAME